jgi:hypothetical protein
MAPPTPARCRPGGLISEYRRSAAIALPAANGSASSGDNTGATSPLSRSARLGRGCSRRRSGIASGAQNASSSRSSPAAPGAVCCRSPNASLQVVATASGHRSARAAQQVRAPLPERCQVPGQAVPAALDVRGGLL